MTVSTKATEISRKQAIIEEELHMSAPKETAIASDLDPLLCSQIVCAAGVRNVINDRPDRPSLCSQVLHPYLAASVKARERP